MSIKSTQNICRTCLSTDGELISLFSGRSHSACLTNKIMNISDVTIKKRDGLPYMICRKCIFLVESFDCFKKQIESANKQIKKCWLTLDRETQTPDVNIAEEIENFVEEAHNDSDYEIQYISEEVKEKVENAFRKKQEKIRKKEAIKNCSEIPNVSDVALIAIEDLVREKNTEVDENTKKIDVESREIDARKDTYNMKIRVESRCIFPYSEEITKHYQEDIEKNVFKSNEPDSPEDKMNDILDEVEHETFQSGNSDCNDRLIIETEEFDDTEEKVPEPEFVDEEKCLESDKINEIQEKTCDHDYHNHGADSKLEGTENYVPPSPDPLNLACDTEDKKAGSPGMQECEKKFSEASNFRSDEETNISGPDKPITDAMKSFSSKKIEAIKDKILEPRMTGFHHTALILPSENIINIGAKILEPCQLYFGIGKILDTNKSDVIGGNALPVCSSQPENEEDDTTNENPLKIAEEAMETEECNNNIEESSGTDILRDIHENEAKRVDCDPNEGSETKKAEGTEENSIDSKGFQEKENGELPKFGMHEKTQQTEEKSIGASKSFAKVDDLRNNELSSKTIISNLGMIPIANGKCYGTTSNEVIVISSDTSDEERRKNYLESMNRRGSWLPRRARKKLFQVRIAARKNQVLQFQTQKKGSETGKNLSQPKNIKAKKYFQCTSCNINLYSVPDVLYHHNQKHTPAPDLLSCQMCDTKFPTKDILHVHFDQHLESHLFRCNFCTCEFVLKRNLCAHMNGHLRPKTEEPEKKRVKIGESREQVEIPMEENVVDSKKSLSSENKLDGSMINEEGGRGLTITTENRGKG